MGVSRNVEIFGLAFEQDIADGTADQKSFEACSIKSVENFERPV